MAPKAYVHCPTCQRAYDVGAGAGCPRCRKPAEERVLAAVESLARELDTLSAAGRRRCAERLERALRSGRGVELRSSLIGAVRALIAPDEPARALVSRPRVELAAPVGEDPRGAFVWTTLLVALGAWIARSAEQLRARPVGVRERVVGLARRAFGRV